MVGVIGLHGRRVRLISRIIITISFIQSCCHLCQISRKSLPLVRVQLCLPLHGFRLVLQALLPHEAAHLVHQHPRRGAATLLRPQCAAIVSALDVGKRISKSIQVGDEFLRGATPFRLFVARLFDLADKGGMANYSFIPLRRGELIFKGKVAGRSWR